MAIARHDRRPDDQSENRSPMITSACLLLTAMLLEPVQSFVPEPSVSAWVPTRTIREPVLLSDLTSPSSMKKYTPRRGHPSRPEVLVSVRAPPTLSAREPSSP